MDSGHLTNIIAKSKSLAISIPLETLISWEMSEDAWCLKDRNGNLIYQNEKYQAFISLYKDATLLSQFNNTIAAHSAQVINEERKIEAIGVLPITTSRDFNMFYCEKLPYYNTSAEIYGVISHIKTLMSISPRFFIFGDGIGDFKLGSPSGIFTDKEWIVAFLSILGPSEKEIAEKLHRTLRTVKFHKSNILQKTLCRNTKEFINLARSKQWQFYIPLAFAQPRYIIK